jgi:transcriptional regulator with XRE-family HTH domain
VGVKKDELPPYAQRLRELRAKLGFRNQTEFAAALGTRQATVSRWLNGTARPLPEVFTRIAALAHGEDRIFFLKEAGIPFNEQGDVDFGLKDVGRGVGKDAIIGINQHNRNKKAGQKSRPDTAPTWDPDLLLWIVETINAGLREKDIPPPPGYGRAVMKIYKICQRDKRRDPAQVLQLFSMVA